MLGLVACDVWFVFNGIGAFFGAGVEGLDIPNTVCELCDRWFFECPSLLCVTFGAM